MLHITFLCQIKWSSPFGQMIGLFIWNLITRHIISTCLYTCAFSPLFLILFSSSAFSVFLLLYHHHPLFFHIIFLSFFFFRLSILLPFNLFFLTHFPLQSSLYTVEAPDNLESQTIHLHFFTVQN